VTFVQLVTDTHPLVYYFCGNQSKLSKKARAAFDSATTSTNTCIYVPGPVLCEFSMLLANSNIRINKTFSDWVDELLRYPGLVSMGTDHEIAKVFHGLSFHSDPFDRMIVASALHLGVPLITNDSKMHEHKPCRLYWD
jgi:PIN domain nuclease of toxin-antitoxin system